MKFTKIFTISSFILLSSAAIADEVESYNTDCNYLLEGDRKSYKGSTATDENIKSVELSDVTPEACVGHALAAIKLNYQTKYLAGGKMWNTNYFNVHATIKITHKDNVDFPLKNLEQTIASDPCVSIADGFNFISPYIGDDYYKAVVKKLSCKK